jgi:hypothetical protein
MLRPHLGLQIDFTKMQVGIGVSRVYFPNGDIDSTQAYLSFEIPFYNLISDPISDSWEKAQMLPDSLSHVVAGGNKAGWRARRYELLSRYYYPASGTRSTAGLINDDRMGLLGFSFTQATRKNRFWYVETMGAVGGTVDGYAQFLYGQGLQWPINRQHVVEIQLGIGAGGGGSVDTGGGMLVLSEIGWRYHITPKLSARLNAGYIDALDGQFRGQTAGLSLAYTLNGISFAKGATPINSKDDLIRHRWKISVVQQSYLPEKGTSRKSDKANNEQVDLIGGKIDLDLDDSWYLTGQALGAYGGGAGGYAAGLIGTGWKYRHNNWAGSSIYTEFLLGAGGGGGIAVGSGLLAQAMVGYEHPLNQKTGIHLSLGWLDAPGGELKAGVIEFGVSYSFTSWHSRLD